MLLHHRNWPVLPPNGRAQGQPGARVDPLSDGTGVAPTHVPTLPSASSAQGIEPYTVPLAPICPFPPVLGGIDYVWELGLLGLLLQQQSPPVSVLVEFDEAGVGVGDFLFF